MNKYKLTVVTTTYNHEKYIGECLDGIVMQKTNFPFKLIISDDCSTDNTKEIITFYAKKYPNIIKPIFRDKNLGPMDNFIETLNVADTEYVAMCDGDDFWIDPYKLQKQVDFLDKHKDYMICFHQTIIFFDNGSKKDEVYPFEMKETTTFDDLLKDCYMPANSVVYRWKYNKKGEFKKIFPKNVVPGDYFVHLLHAKNGKIKFMEEVMSKYRRHEGGMWWLTSDASQSISFHLKYGMRYIRFYEAVEKQFSLKPEIYQDKINYLKHETLKSIIASKDFNQLNSFNDEYPDYYDYYFQNMSDTPFYYNFSKIKRFFYIFIFEPKLFWSSIFRKVKKMFLKLKNAIVYLFINPKKFKAKVSRKFRH